MPGPHFSVTPNLDNPIYPAPVVVVIASALAEGSTSTRDALQGGGIEANTLHSPTTCVSLQQMMTVFRNAIRLTPPPCLSIPT